MGAVSQYLRDLIARQVKEHGIVVWFDPEHHFSNFVADLQLPDTRLFRFEKSFFALRAQLEPFIDAAQRPRLIVYVPLELSKTHQALSLSTWQSGGSRASGPSACLICRRIGRWPPRPDRFCSKLAELKRK